MKNIIKLVLVMLLVGSSYENHAKELYIYHGAWSKHMKTSSYVTEETRTETITRDCGAYGRLGRHCIPSSYDVTYTEKVKNSFNEDHNLIGIQYGSYMLGWFRNSFDDDSAIVVKEFGLLSGYNFDVDLSAGGTYGYKSCSVDGLYDRKDKKKVCPHAALNLVYTKFKVQPVLSVDLSGSVISLELRYQL